MCTKFGSASTLLVLGTILLELTACGGGEKNRVETDKNDGGEITAADIGPVSSVVLEEIRPELVEQGERLFNTRCTTCHRFDERYIGPPLREVAGRREPVFIMNMILNPEGMLAKHPVAKELIAEYAVPMTNQNLTQEEARAILEYLREVAQQPPESVKDPAS